MSQAPANLSWSFLDSWSRPVAAPSWTSTEAWAGALQALSADDRTQLAKLRAEWDRDLALLGGDPSAFDWSSFRPLRREREEDWSDWLAQLIGDDREGALASRIFGRLEGRARGQYAAETVEREYQVENRRADLVFRWKDGRYTHVEVKVGDPHLEKTPDTCEKVRTHLGCEGSDFLLILPDQEEAWHKFRESTPSCPTIHVLTWRDVSRALRITLTEKRDDIRWSVWAHALCGTIDDNLLGVPGGGSPSGWSARLSVSTLRTALDLLERTSRNGDTDV